MEDRPLSNEPWPPWSVGFVLFLLWVATLEALRARDTSAG
jgi:hypothetical protein